jgi:5-methylthioribose kinase
MFVLTADNALDYLRRQGWLDSRSAQVEPLGWGVSNLVLRIVTPERAFIVKQSRPQLRTRDPWLSDLERNYREQEIMDVLGPLLPAGIVPRVLFSDRANYVFAMTHAPAGTRVWKETLLTGKVDQTVGALAGRVLGQMHEATASDPVLSERFSERTVFVQLRVDPFYRRVQERRPEVAQAVEPILQAMLTRNEALCHGDYSPKNILTHDQGFMLVDYETAHFGDPTMDLGFFLSHLILKAIKHQPIRQQFYDLTRTFWQNYAETVRFRPRAELEARGIQHFAVCALARIDGTSPVDYLPEESKRETARRIGRHVLWYRPASWDAVLNLCESCLSA